MSTCSKSGGMNWKADKTKGDNAVTTRDEIATAMASAEEEVRLQAIRELAGLDPEQGLDLVFQGFADESWRVRKEAIDLFLSMPVCRDLVGEIIELLHAEENAGLRNAAVEILTRMGRDAVPMLLEQARCPDHDVRKFIVDILGDIGDERAVPVLITGLADDDSNVRAASAENLGKLRAQAGVPALLDAMSHPDLLLQFTILDALSRIGAPIAFPRLAPFRDEKLLRKALVDCLGKVGDTSALPELIRSLTDPMRNVREAAVSALDHIGQRFPEPTRDALREAATDPLVVAVSEHLGEAGNAGLRVAAIRILGWIQAGRAIPLLLRYLDQEALQRDCLEALVEIGRAQPQAMLDAWQEVDHQQRAYLAYVLGEARCAASQNVLRQALTEHDEQVRRMAAYALGRLEDPAVLDDLVAVLRRDAAPVQEAASQALVNLGQQYPAETLAALRPLLASAEAAHRRFAVTIIGQLPAETISDHLSHALKDPDAEVRQAALKAFEGRDTEAFLNTLLLALTDEDTEVRRIAVDILGASEAPEAVAGLQSALRDEDIWVRANAVRSLGRRAEGDSLQAVEAAVNDPVGLVSIAALETLAERLGERACPRLVAALDHADEEVVTAALDLLAGFPPEGWFEPQVETLINHPYWAVRSHFARHAAQLLGPKAVPILKQRLAEEHEDLVRQQLTELLDDLQG